VLVVRAEVEALDVITECLEQLGASSYIRASAGSADSAV
jgi:hypothetical protein